MFTTECSGVLPTGQNRQFQVPVITLQSPLNIDTIGNTTWSPSTPNGILRSQLDTHAACTYVCMCVYEVLHAPITVSVERVRLDVPFKSLLRGKLDATESAREWSCCFDIVSLSSMPTYVHVHATSPPLVGWDRALDSPRHHSTQ